MLTTFLFIPLFSLDTLMSPVRKPAGCDLFAKANVEKILGTDVTWTGTDSTAKEQMAELRGK